MEKQLGYRRQFIGSLVLVSLIAIIAYVCLAHSYRQRLDGIREIQIADCEQMSNVIKSVTMNKMSLSIEADWITKALEKHEERMESLMEMEFEKLQNDFNFISLWAGIITIVFLIFSIYSIFKTDEMLKKSETVYEQIKGKADVIENVTKDIQTQYNNELELLKKESDNYSKEMAQKMTLLNERLASVDVMIRQYKESIQTDDAVQASTEEQVVQEKQTKA